MDSFVLNTSVLFSVLIAMICGLSENDLTIEPRHAVVANGTRMTFTCTISASIPGEHPDTRFWMVHNGKNLTSDPSAPAYKNNNTEAFATFEAEIASNTDASVYTCVVSTSGKWADTNRAEVNGTVLVVSGDKNDEEKNPIGLVVGIVAAAVAIVGLGLGVILCYCKKRLPCQAGSETLANINQGRAGNDSEDHHNDSKEDVFVDAPEDHEANRKQSKVENTSGMWTKGWENLSSYFKRNSSDTKAVQNNFEDPEKEKLNK